MLKKSVALDSSSAILLYKCSLMDNLLKSYHIIIPQSVYHELTDNQHPGSNTFENFVKDKRLYIQENSSEHAIHSDYHQNTTKLGPGERDAIFLLLQDKADFIIVDDGKAASFLRDYNHPYICALLLPKIFYFSGILDKKTSLEYMEQLTETGRYSEIIIHTACRLTRNDLEDFLI